MADKTELPLAQDSEIESLVSRFEACQLPYEHWTHRAHLAVAVMYLRQHTFENALARTRERIQAYNHHCGDPDGYNETVTRMFLRKIHAETERSHRGLTMHEEVAELSRICTVAWLYRYYSAELIWSDAAKSGWVEPDGQKIDF